MNQSPKEKAIELVAKMRKKFRIHSAVNHHGVAKKCALIAVDEILNVYLIRHVRLYWQEVKNEIENL